MENILQRKISTPMNKLIAFLTLVTLAMSCTSSADSKKQDEVADEPATESITKEVDMTSHPGYAVYRQHCLPCHQADGNGVPGMHPSLHNTDWVNGEKEALVGIILYGMSGEIEVNGEYYNSVMAPLPYLSDREIADVLTYIRTSFGNSASEITAEEVRDIRNRG
jgi:mono/diheme cytochrome c family protein